MSILVTLVAGCFAVAGCGPAGDSEPTGSGDSAAPQRDAAWSDLDSGLVTPPTRLSRPFPTPDSITATLEPPPASGIEMLGTSDFDCVALAAGGGRVAALYRLPESGPAWAEERAISLRGADYDVRITRRDTAERLTIAHASDRLFVNLRTVGRVDELWQIRLPDGERTLVDDGASVPPVISALGDTIVGYGYDESMVARWVYAPPFSPTRAPDITRSRFRDIPFRDPYRDGGYWMFGAQIGREYVVDLDGFGAISSASPTWVWSFVSEIRAQQLTSDFTIDPDRPRVVMRRRVDVIGASRGERAIWFAGAFVRAHASTGRIEMLWVPPTGVGVWIEPVALDDGVYFLIELSSGSPSCQVVFVPWGDEDDWPTEACLLPGASCAVECLISAYGTRRACHRGLTAYDCYRLGGQAVGSCTAEMEKACEGWLGTPIAMCGTLPDLSGIAMESKSAVVFDCRSPGPECGI